MPDEPLAASALAGAAPLPLGAAAAPPFGLGLEPPGVGPAALLGPLPAVFFAGAAGVEAFWAPAAGAVAEVAEPPDLEALGAVAPAEVAPLGVAPAADAPGFEAADGDALGALPAFAGAAEPAPGPANTALASSKALPQTKAASMLRPKDDEVECRARRLLIGVSSERVKASQLGDLMNPYQLPLAKCC